MAKCKPLMIWRPVPDKSRLQASVTGDDNFFDVEMTIDPAGQPTTTVPHGDLVPGPSETPINQGDQITLDLVLNITTTPAENKPVVVDLRIVDKDGTVVKVGDGKGGTRSAQCSTQYTEATGENPIGIVVVAVAVK